MHGLGFRFVVLEHKAEFAGLECAGHLVVQQARNTDPMDGRGGGSLGARHRQARSHRYFERGGLAGRAKAP